MAREELTSLQAPVVRVCVCAYRSLEVTGGTRNVTLQHLLESGGSLSAPWV